MPELREHIAELEKTQVKLQHDLDEKTEIAEAADGQKGSRGFAQAQPVPLLHVYSRSLEPLWRRLSAIFRCESSAKRKRTPPLAKQEPHQITE